jgi:glycosyltransferase involved in cell wall biosynthesis
MSRIEKILYVDHSAVVGGAEISLESLVCNLDTRSFGCTVALPDDGPFVGRLQARGVHVEIVRLESWRWWVQSPSDSARFIITLPLQFLSLYRWLRFLHNLRPDIVHFNISRIIEPVIAARLLGLPCVMHFRDIPSKMDYRFALGRTIFWKIMNLCTAWIANSYTTWSDIFEFCSGTLVVIPNGLDLRRFDEYYESGEWAPDHRKIRVAMIGLLVPWKNHVGFIHMAAELSKQREDIEFLIAGDGDKTYTDQLRALASRQGLGDRLRFLGSIENVPSFLSTVDVLVHPVEKESFGRVFIEAMAARVPIVAYNAGASKEIVVDWQTGILVEAHDPVMLQTAVLRLVSDPALRKVMGEAGRRRVEAYYSIDEHVRSVTQLYRSLR